MKKTLLILLTLIIGINLTTQAQDFYEVHNGDTIYYNITLLASPRTVEVANQGQVVSSSVVIPDSVFYGGYYYKVTSIGNYAFVGCIGLTSITIPNSVTSIGNSAFEYCSGLTSITIPNSVTSIGESAFGSCSGLTSITIPNSVTSIGRDAFWSCIGLTSITIPNSVTSIGDAAFYGTPWYNNKPNGVVYVNNILYKYKGTMPANTTINIQSGTVSVSASAFYQCTGLTSITIPSSVTSIGSAAFSGCSGLTSITIPNSVTSIGVGAFYGTPYYNNIPDGVVYINNMLYEYKGTMPANTTINIQTGTISISPYVFFDCYGLTSITIPNSVTSIGTGAFSGCSELTSITIPNSVTSIGSSAFYECTRLTSITIPNSITSIGDGAFSACSGLTSITIPNSVISIGDEAFSACSGLTSITIPNSVTSIGRDAFGGCSGLTSITIPNSVTSIGLWAFFRCSGLTSITIPNSVTSIGNYTFADCSGLTSITIPNSVTLIGESAFSGCSGLTSITSKAINPPSILFYSFGGVNDSIPIYVPCSSISLYQQAEYWSYFSNYKCDPIGLDDELKLSTSTKLYPNPTNNKSKLEVEGLKSEADVIVLDLLGRVIKSYKINPTMKELEIDVNGFAKGVYSVSVQNNNINVSKKLIVQ